MSMPNIPDINPKITITKEDAKNILLVSVGLEEIALAHILNAEGEKIQSFLGTLECQEVKENISIEDLEKLDNMVNETIKTITEKEQVLLKKLEEINKIDTNTSGC